MFPPKNEEEKTSDDADKVVDRRYDKSMVSPSYLSFPVYTENELDEAMESENPFNEDSYNKKTFTRILVENVLSKYNWYFPARNTQNPPSLSKAYAYYEHVTLPRHFAGADQAKHVLRRAEPGERKEQTELYNVLTTPASSFIEWGLGVDQYFMSLRSMAVILFIAGLIHLPNLKFYRNEEYCPAEKDGFSISLKGSAVCTAFEWVACWDCEVPANGVEENLDRFGFVDVDGQNVTLVEKYACNGGKLEQGSVNYVCMYFLLAAIFLMHLYLSAREIRIDEDKVTSSDYTVVVENPPKDASDPDEWRDYFSQFGHVTAVTVALNNEKLLKALIQRRRVRNELRLALPKKTNMDDMDEVAIKVEALVRDRQQEGTTCFGSLMECTVYRILRLVGMFLPPEQLYERLGQLTDNIKEMQKEKYDVVKIYVTFETEDGQRNAMQSLAVGKLNVLMNNKSDFPPSALFRDKLLILSEPPESDAVRWLDLSASNIKMTIMQILTLLLTCGLLGVCGLAVARVRFNLGARYSAPLVSVFNAIIPQIVKITMNLMEPHHSEGTYQSSLYLKITLFRWVNTALLAKMITPWMNTLGTSSNDILPQINSVMWSEFWLVPTLRVLDLWGNFQKHFLAPRARTQEQMNMKFQGTPYNLGERYTDLSKVLFLCFFYSALYPASFFFGTAILLIQYYSDKFCLMRVWAYSPSLGSEVARFARRHFFSAALLAYCVISAYAWAGFPYDNLCFDDKNTVFGANGTYTNVPLANGMIVDEIDVSEEKFFVQCQQSWKGFDGLLFPPTARKQPSGKHWMGESQEILVNAFGYTSILALALYFGLLFGSSSFLFLVSWFRGVYKPRGQEQHIDFSSDYEIFGYVPQIRVSGFSFPFLACDVDNVDQSLIGWTDRGHTYDYHNMIFDVPMEGMRERNYESSPIPNFNRVERKQYETKRPTYSTITHYPPEWMLKIQ